MMRPFLLALLAAALVSCNRQNLKYDKPYFDFDSLVHVQMINLGNSKVTVIKTSALNGRRDSTSIVPDTAQWKHELDAFQQLDVINKPSFKDAYHYSEAKDVHSNLQVRTFLTHEKSAVPWVKFYYLGDLKKLKKIESVYNERNAMFSSGRKLTLEFDNLENELVLMHYQVKGYQKMMLSDSVLFQLDGKIVR
ncbi:hypothetical protein WSM22_11540 [Cytophagales bacterium WSM2-2]|nr:hypothetical protein WSM22_11540 [Cytophagales bacterium WSM2-2]